MIYIAGAGRRYHIPSQDVKADGTVKSLCDKAAAKIAAYGCLLEHEVKGATMQLCPECAASGRQLCHG
jgi:hypothetical protein